MKYFSFYEIFNSVICAALLGFIFGSAYKSARSIFFMLVKTVLIIPKKLLQPFCNKKINKPKAIFNNLIDTLYFSLFGISLILILYITLDGVIRLYFFVITAIIFFFSHKTFGKYISVLLNYLFDNVYHWLDKIITIVFIPLYYLVKILKPKILSVIYYINSKYILYKSKKIMKNKICEIEKTFKLCKTD